MTETMEAAANTDRELWREVDGDYYANSIHVTAQGGIGINVGGTVIVKRLGEWHAIARPLRAATEPTEAPTVTQEARRLLAAELSRDGFDQAAMQIRDGERMLVGNVTALRAIDAALWPADAQFQFGELVTTPRAPFFKGRICGWYRNSEGRLGFNVEAEAIPLLIHNYPQSGLRAFTTKETDNEWR